MTRPDKAKLANRLAASLRLKARTIRGLDRCPVFSPLGDELVPDAEKMTAFAVNHALTLLAGSLDSWAERATSDEEELKKGSPFLMLSRSIRDLEASLELAPRLSRDLVGPVVGMAKEVLAYARSKFHPDGRRLDA